MFRVILPLALVAVLVAGWAYGAQASDQQVRLYSGPTALGDRQGDVVVHRGHRPPYDHRNYRRVSLRTTFFGHRSGVGAPGSIAKPKPKSRQTRYEPDATDRYHRHHDIWRPRDRIVIILVPPVHKKFPTGLHGQPLGSDQPPPPPGGPKHPG